MNLCTRRPIQWRQVLELEPRDRCKAILETQPFTSYPRKQIMGGLTGENFLPGSAEHVCAQQSPCGDQHPPHSPIYRRYRATGVPSPLSAAFDAPTHIKTVTTHSLSPNTRMLSSLTQLLAIEPLALVGTAVAGPDERELAVAQRRHVPSQRTSKTRGKEHLLTESPQKASRCSKQQLQLIFNRILFACECCRFSHIARSHLHRHNATQPGRKDLATV